MGLFDKKYCDVCGEKIGLLGNRKLADGNLCKECAGKLSPFFSERKQSTVEEIKAQLAYREENRDAVERFAVARVIQCRNKFLFVDTAKGNFMVNHRKDYREDNPDVIPMSAVTGVDADTTESRNELMKEDKDGKKVSFTPPRYEYSFDVFADIHVNHPYFDGIRVQLADDIVMNGMGREVPDPSRNPRYREAMQQAEEIREILGQGAGAAPAEPVKAVKCPNCGATTIPDPNGCCEYCGSALS